MAAGPGSAAGQSHATTTPLKGGTMTAHAVLGKSIARVDGREKVTGQTRYTGDLQLPGMLYAKLVLSLHAHARIARIDKADALRVPGVVDVITGEDVLEVAPNARESMLLALGATVYYGHPVAAVLGETEAAAEEGAAAVVVEYEELPAALEALAAMEPNAPESKITLALMAVIRPSPVQPVFSSMIDSGAGVVLR